MIDLPIEAHILGTLWVLKFGILIDNKLTSNCYGNRIRRTVIDGDKDFITPYLFYPYF